MNLDSPPQRMQMFQVDDCRREIWAEQFVLVLLVVPRCGRKGVVKIRPVRGGSRGLLPGCASVT